MVLISDKKYACEACIKGHRSSACKHTDRPLFEIKKKGRPITQCEHCRELRKTKQVHVKCMCEAKEHPPDKEPAPARKKGNLARVLASAAFPDGLPQVLGASVATHSTDMTSPMDYATRVCCCKDGLDCHCLNAKKSRSPKAKDHGVPPPTSSMSSTTAPVPIGLHALRPVLPRPHPQPSSLNEHVASNPHPHNHRFSHGSAFFSPYGRAYEEHHYSSEEGHADNLPENVLGAHRSTDLVAWSSDSSGHSLSHKTFPPSFSDLQDELDSPEFPAGFRGFCTCGETCACPTCLQHRGPIAWSSQEACPNPGSCNGCLRPSEVPPHHAPTPPTTPQDGRIPQQFEPLEEWIKNMPMIPPSFDDATSKQDIADYSIFDLPRIVEPMPITLDSLPDVFHEPTTQCICATDQRIRLGDYCVRCQRRCDDHEAGDQGDLLAATFSADRAQRCFPSDVPMLTVPPPRSRASSTSSVASDLSSLYPHSIEDTNGVPAGSLLPPSLSRVRRLASDLTSPIVADGVSPAYAMPYPSSASDLAHTSSDSYDASYPGSISMLF